MSAIAAVFEGLVDDAAMFPPGSAEVADAVAAHREYRRSWFAPLIGPLVVSDQKLAGVGRALSGGGSDAGRDEVLAVSVVNTSGAGGLVSLAQRHVAGVRVVAIESALRDLDDLAGNAARVVSAAADLDDEVAVFVEIPYAPGWERVVSEVEAAGHFGKIRTGGPDPLDTPAANQLARQLSVLIEADLSFKATAGLHHALPTPGADPATPRQHGFLTLLAAVAALVDGATERDAADLLCSVDGAALAESIGGWSQIQATRTRRRFRSFGCCGVLDPVGDLVALGLVAEPS
ncbi:MAG TPA: hypothetical protein VFP89_09395 [Propionibacteriaceae bacterium]|nr:hypothetical protein [Propionibacteriaceae bacterium]